VEYGRLLDDKQVSAAGFPEEDLTPQIARRAYELYEQRGCKSGQPNQDWLQAEREINEEGGLTHDK
jgi:hypothetical protein